MSLTVADTIVHAAVYSTAQDTGLLPSEMLHHVTM